MILCAGRGLWYSFLVHTLLTLEGVFDVRFAAPGSWLFWYGAYGCVGTPLVKRLRVFSLVGRSHSRTVEAEDMAEPTCCLALTRAR